MLGLSLLFAVGCGLVDGADANGRITELGRGPGGEPAVFVQFNAEVPHVGSEAWVKTTASTQVERGGDAAEVTDLQVNDDVALWLEDGVNDSNPPQVSAAQIVASP